jgi:serine/threonine-protein kinase PRP4
MGKGVFSNVVRAIDMDSDSESSILAIKIIRNNEATLRSGHKEIKIMQTIQNSDPEDKHHCLKMLSSFTFSHHLCICFENLEMNLREVIRRYGDGIGLSIAGVREYGKQLLRALLILKRLKILHCDCKSYIVKPDNILAYEHLRMVKLADFGSAMFEDERHITDNLVPRFYRAPEIILGASYDYGIDMWSFGCTLFELYTGQILFPGRSNSEMLKLFMELFGPISKRIRNRGKFTFQYFDNNFFYYSIPDSSNTLSHFSTPLSDLNKISSLSIRLCPESNFSKSVSPSDSSSLSSLSNFLELCLSLDSHDRISPEEALNHSFFQS